MSCAQLALVQYIAMVGASARAVRARPSSPACIGRDRPSILAAWVWFVRRASPLGHDTWPDTKARAPSSIERALECIALQLRGGANATLNAGEQGCVLALSSSGCGRTSARAFEHSARTDGRSSLTGVSTVCHMGGQLKCSIEISRMHRCSVRMRVPPHVGHSCPFCSGCPD
eukprot:scaffold2982_cov154-Isochrysis_galbana.AAC.1